MSLEDEIRAVVARHCETLLRDLEEVAESIARLYKERSDASVDAAIRISHRIKGSSGSIGFPAVSQAAAALEEALRAAASCPSLLTSEEAVIAMRFHELKRLVVVMAPENSTLVRAKV